MISTSKTEDVVCIKCKMLWDMIRRDEDELFKMKKHPKVYGKTIEMIEQDLQRRYAIVRKCRENNHPEDQY